MEKTKVKMNKPIYPGLSVLDIAKTIMYEFWYNCIKQKYGDRAKLCYTDTDSFVVYIKTEDFYEEIANDVERQFDTSNYDENDERSLPIGKNKKVYGLFKDELSGKIMTEFVALRAKPYTYLIEDGSEHKKAKVTKKCVKNANLCSKTIRILYLMMKSYQNYNKDLKVIIIRFTQKKLIRLC